MTHILNAENFHLELDVDILDYSATYALPVNALLSISVSSDGFSAATYMDVDVRSFATFCDNLYRLCRELRGTAAIHEVFVEENGIEFTGDGDGLILVSGRLNNHWRDGLKQELSFENTFGQPCLCNFACELYDTYHSYMYSG